MKLVAPTRVKAALAAIREAHPYAASGAVARSTRADVDSHALWVRLMALGGAERDAAIKALSRREESLLLYGARARLANDPALALLADVFTIRALTTRASIAWEAWLASNGNNAFRDAAEAATAGGPAARTARLLLSVQRPLDEVCRLYCTQALPFHAWSSQPEVQLDRPSVLSRIIRQRLLRFEFVHAVVEREGMQTLEAWLEECLVDSDRVNWFGRYLSETDPRRWGREDAILLRILARFQPPDKKQPFWDGVPTAAVTAFNNWLKDRALTHLLGEGERVQFWRQFLPQMVRCEDSRCGEAVFICFDQWFAVQFKAMGRATYMFHMSDRMLLRRHAGNVLYARILDRQAYAVGRYEHRGEYWQATARAEVLRVLRELSS